MTLLDELWQSVKNAAEQKMSAWIALGGTTVAGTSTWLALLPTLIGIVASLVGLVLSVILGWGQIKKGRVERQVLYMQRDILAEREHERLEKAQQRKSEGYPCLRDDDGTGAQCDL